MKPTVSRLENNFEHQFGLYLCTHTRENTYADSEREDNQHRPNKALPIHTIEGINQQPSTKTCRKHISHNVNLSRHFA